MGFKSLRWSTKTEEAGVVREWRAWRLGWGVGAGGWEGDSNHYSPSLADTEVSEHNICKVPL